MRLRNKLNALTSFRIVGFWAIASMLLVGAAAPAASQEQAMERQFPAAPGQKLELDLKTGGSINIAGWDQSAVSVRTQMGGRDWQDIKVDFEESPSGVRVISRYVGPSDSHSNNLKFEINVPRRYDVDMNTMGGGIHIADVEGTLSGKTMGGAINLERVQGVVKLKTMGGAVSVTDSNIDGQVTTMGGAVRYKNVSSRTGAAPGEGLNISTMGGAIEVDDAPNGANVSTMGGAIHIGSAGQFVKAKTMGGSITIDAIDGGVKATTMGGRVTVTMVGDPNQGQRDVELSSMGGDISLTVPAGLSMDVDITLAYTEDRREDYRIISDFGIQQEETPNWDDTHGTPRKYIYGRGAVAGGRNKVKINTINGNVYLKRGN